jgi:hypothetical protein
VPQQDTDPRAGDDLRPTWDLYRRMADSPNVKPGRRDAVLWALGQLERRMGPDWLERYWESAGHVPEEVNLGSGHVAAFGNLLDLALRYQVLDGAPGIGQVQREMRNDLRDERRWHSALQLEVAALGVRAGFTAALEAQSVGRGSPSDVIMRRDGRLLQIETFVVLRDERSREAAQYWDWLMAQIRNIGWRSGTGVSGDLGERLAHDVSAELLRLIETAVQAAVDTGEEQTVEFQTARLRVLPPGSTTYQLRGGVEEGKGWPRIEAKLVQKARQASSAGGGWLRADVRDGMWQFTPWARAGLRAQIEEIARLIRPVLGQVRGIEGVVLSSGALLAQGEFYGESAATEDGCYGLRRVLPAVRVRETMIVPVTARGRDEARIWRELYNAEENWLDWALNLAGLPQRDQIFAP